MNGGGGLLRRSASMRRSLVIRRSSSTVCRQAFIARRRSTLNRRSLPERRSAPVHTSGAPTRRRFGRRPLLDDAATIEWLRVTPHPHRPMGCERHILSDHLYPNRGPGETSCGWRSGKFDTVFRKPRIAALLSAVKAGAPVPAVPPVGRAVMAPTVEDAPAIDIEAPLAAGSPFFAVPCGG